MEPKGLQTSNLNNIPQCNSLFYKQKWGMSIFPTTKTLAEVHVENVIFLLSTLRTCWCCPSHFLTAARQKVLRIPSTNQRQLTPIYIRFQHPKDLLHSHLPIKMNKKEYFHLRMLKYAALQSIPRRHDGETFHLSD